MAPSPQLSFFKIWPFSAEFHMTHMYSIYKYLAKILLLRDLNEGTAMETIEKRIEKSLVLLCFGKILLNKVYIVCCVKNLTSSLVIVK